MKKDMIAFYILLLLISKLYEIFVHICQGLTCDENHRIDSRHITLAKIKVDSR